MKILDVGGGYHKYPGSESIDANPLTKPDILHDLNIYPWPIKDNEYDMVYTSHVLEHLDDPKKAIEEIWRITKSDGKVIIKVPHFSSRLAWTDIEHKRAFSINMLRTFEKQYDSLIPRKVRFSVEKIRLRWQPRIDKELLPAYVRKYVPIINFVNSIITFLANLNVDLCERIWCYYVGGMGEVEFHAKVVK